MLLLPIGRDDAVIQRHAWISYAIIAFNVVIFIATTTIERGGAGFAVEHQWETTMRYYAAHPYLHVPASMERFVPARLAAQARDAGPAPRDADVGAEQRELDGMAGELTKAYHALPRIRFAFIPAEGQTYTIVTSMFLHTGFMHLFGNMLFFFVTGPFVEDVFGRPMFLFLYFTGGGVATAWYASKHHDSTIPLIGASGAIAAVMGAYFVRFVKSKLEFLFMPFPLFRPTLHFRFFMPAFVVLPLWFAQQFFLSNTAESSGAGVAFSAHVGGFVYGFVVALVIKAVGFEEKFVVPVVEKQTTWKQDERLLQAMAARDKGDLAGAGRQVAALLGAQPANVDALRFAVDVSLETHDDRSLDRYALRLLNRYVEDKQDDLATALITELHGAAAPRFLARAAGVVERRGDRDWALLLYERLCELETAGPNAVGSLVKLGALRKTAGDVGGARAALAQARALPECSAEWASSIDEKLRQLA